ncbi:hypothetical protein FG05_35090 [Fusarium graminearum]|nr:hypothetical protein FG05_35090 [Fusarium graminearum]
MRAYKNEANGGDDSEASSRKAMQSGAILYKKEYYRSSVLLPALFRFGDFWCFTPTMLEMDLPHYLQSASYHQKLEGPNLTSSIQIKVREIQL